MNRGGRVIVKILTFLLMTIFLSIGHGMAVSAEIGTDGGNNVADIDATGTENPANPVHHCTQLNDGSDYTDWSYVYFGSYPQSEVTGSALTSAITEASYDANGDAWVNGTKYRRLSKSDTNDDTYFGDSTYRYFKWERVKWRVLKVDGSTMFIMADKGLDCKCYNDIDASVTWETCTLRNWLNNDFYSTAFNNEEQGAIVSQTVVNEDSPYYNTAGGNDTRDKVYLLSLSEVMNPDYGFCANDSTFSMSRIVQSNDYAHVRGTYIDANSNYDYVGNGFWWLRSPGHRTNYATGVDYNGRVFKLAYVAISYDVCAPVLHINLSSTFWQTSDDGTSGAGGITPVIPEVSSPTPHTVKAGTSATFSVTARGGNPSTYTYQWYYATSRSGTGTKISGATASSYTITSSDMTAGLNGRYYYCIVNNGIYDVSSSRARLTVENASASLENNVPGQNSGTGGSGTNNVLSAPIPQRIEAFSYTKEYGSKSFYIQASTSGNGTLTYQSSNQKVAEVSADGLVKLKSYGTATITIQASQTPTYQAATKQITIEVIPKKVKLKKVQSPGSRRISLKWKKDKKVIGYEIYISPNKNFKSRTIRRTYPKSKTNVALIGLQSKKTYYVKIRSYAKVGKKKCYGEWSKTKNVKIK